MSGSSNDTIDYDASGLSAGAISGIVIGVISGLIVLLLVCFCVIIKCWPFGSTTTRTDNYSTGQPPVVPSNDPRDASSGQRPVIPSTISRDASPGPSVAPADPRRTLQEYRAESPARVGGERRDRSDSQRRGYPPTRTRFRPTSPPHVYLASEADTDDFIQMARHDRGKG